MLILIFIYWSTKYDLQVHDFSKLLYIFGGAFIFIGELPLLGELFFDLLFDQVIFEANYRKSTSQRRKIIPYLCLPSFQEYDSDNENIVEQRDFVDSQSIGKNAEIHELQHMLLIQDRSVN